VARKTPRELGGRERQIFETVQRLEEAAVADVRKHLADAPAYSSVRTILGILVDKGYLKYRRDGKRYLYRPAVSAEKSRQTALRRMLGTFFEGSPGDAVAALLEMSAGDLSSDELDNLVAMIDKARKGKPPK